MGVVQMILRSAGLLLLVLFCASSLPVLAGTSENEHFARTWERTDKLVGDGTVSRSWIWGPVAISPVMQEPYAESPGGVRQVQYFDKARMEITHPDSGDPDSIWYVTNGLLAFELIIGNVQSGDSTFEFIQPAAIPVAGDLDDPASPTYSTFSPMYESNLLSAPPRSIGAIIDERVSRHGITRVDPDLDAQGVTVAFLDETTNHAVAAPFWDFMNATGSVYEDGALVTAPLFENPFFGTGRPIAEAYWATVPVAGTPRDVLLQCFERRCLTYTPGNPEGFIVEAGNVGLHYYMWRYADTE
jgi:hypothetical protein